VTERYTIHQGDALDLIPTLGKFDLIVTDPPYVIGAVSAGNIASKAGTWGDMMNSSRWYRDWYVMARASLRQDGAMWTFCNWRSLPVVMKAAIDSGWNVASVLVWHKDWIGPGGPIGLRPAYELVALMPMPSFAIPDRGIPDVWTEQWASYKPNGHPAEKPVALMRRLISASAKEGGRILDPFAGSGSTLRAGLDLGCEVVGIETEERYIQICRERCAQLTLGDVA
jgi:DNA modification methylase